MAMIEREYFMVTSSLNHVGFKPALYPTWYGAEGRVQKKSPAFARKTGDFTRLYPSQSYPRRLPSEGYPD
jgi:hypothetical protein